MSVMGEPNFASYAAQRASGFGGNLTVVDKVPPEMLHMINSYWYQFPPLNPLWHGILAFIIGTLGCISVVGNGMVIYIFSSTKSLRTPSNLLIINLALSDFLMLATMAPPMIINCYNETWVFGPFFCQVYGMMGSLWGCASLWSLVFIALDRYNVIVKGLSAKPLTNKRAVVYILFNWAMSTGWCVAPLFGWSRYVPEGNMAVCGTDYLTLDLPTISYFYMYAIIAYFLPFFMIVYCYWYIVQAVSAHEKAMREQAKKMNVASLRNQEANATSAECKLAKIALMTIFLWFMAWTPYLITNIVGLSGSSNMTPLATIWCSIFAKASSVYNPIVYGISHPKYRQALHAKFPSLACGSEPADHHTNNNDTTSQASAVSSADEKPAA